MTEKRVEDIKNFLKELIKFKTVHTNKEELEKCAKFIKNKAEKLGLKAEIYEGKVPNVLIKKDVGSNKTLTLVTHFDVVPSGKGWDNDPFEPLEKEGKIFGRGATDDKGHLAVAFYALLDSKPKVNVQLAIAGGEETQKSIDFFEKVAENTDLALVVDTGPLDEIQIGTSGFLGYWIKIKGKSGHSAYHYIYDNPVEKLDKVIKAINELREYAFKNFKSNFGGRSYEKVPVRIIPTIIRSSSEAINAVSDEVEIFVNIRTVPEYNNDFIDKWFKEKLKEKLKDVNFEIKDFEIKMDAWISKEAKELDLLKEIVNKKLNKEPKITIMPAGSDGYHFAKKGVKTIEYGFSKSEYNIHSKNEYAPIEDLEKLYSILVEFLNKVEIKE